MDFDTVFSLIMDKIVEGEEISIEKYCQEYPQYKEKLLAKLQAAQFIKNNLREEDFSGKWFGEYIILKELGRGGMGIVFLALQPSLSRLVTIKLLPPGFAGDALVLRSFQEEARIIAKFSHPNIIPIHSFGTEKGITYIAMAYVPGLSLKDVISKLRQMGKFENCKASVVRDVIFPSVTESQSRDTSGQSIGLKRSVDFWNKSYYEYVATIGEEIAEAITYAHQNGIFHGDLKPANILLTADSIPMVVDFGLAKDIKKVSHPSNLSKVEEKDFSGTLTYAAPEQIKENIRDQKTDIWALGVTLYEFLTLKVPFSGSSLDKTAEMILKDLPLPLRSHNRKIPAELEAIVLKCLEKKSENRYNLVSELSRDLNNYLQSKPIQAKSVGILGRFSKWRKRNPRLSSLLLLSMILGMILLLLLFNKRINDLNKEGISLYENGQYTQALGSYNQALQLLKWTPFREQRTKETFKDSGRAWRGKGDFAQAILCFKKAIEIDPKYAAAIGYLADTYLEMGDYDNALKYYKAAVTVSPEDRYNYYNLGQAYTSKELWDAAIESYHTSINIAPNDVEALAKIVSVLHQKGLHSSNEITEYLRDKNFTPAQIESVLKLLPGSAN